MIPFLTKKTAAEFARIALVASEAKGRQFYDWRNSPEADANGKWTQSTGWGDSAKTMEITSEAAAAIFKDKLDGAYGERFMLSVAYAVSAVAAGIPVAIVQIAKEAGTPFDPEGWLVLAINGHPFFHIAPWDCPTVELEKAGLVTVVQPGTPEATEVAWKPEIGADGKPKEFNLLLEWLISGLEKR
jgi:hypothetical protein